MLLRVRRVPQKTRVRNHKPGTNNFGMKAGFDPTAWAAAVAQAVRLLAGREHSRFELRQKMTKKGHPAELIEAVLEDLQQRDYQSDERFTKAFIRSRVSRCQGPQKIFAQLSQRGIRVDNLDSYLPGDHDWNALACESLSRGAPIRASNARKFREAAYRRLSSRGFSHSQSMAAIKDLPWD